MIVSGTTGYNFWMSVQVFGCLHLEYIGLNLHVQSKVNFGDQIYGCPSDNYINIFGCPVCFLVVQRVFLLLL